MPSVDTIACWILGLSLSGCGLLEVGPASRITKIEPVSFRVEVVELGPLNPERVAFPSDAPVAEFLPGDRVRLEIEVVDTDGLALADSRLDSVWLLLGSSALEPSSRPALDDPILDVRCDELEEWTLDSSCRLGEGRGSIEFVTPELGESKLGISHGLEIYAVIAWNGESAERCWAARREHDLIPSDCDFLRVAAAVGPIWWLHAHAIAQGLHTEFAVEQFPAAVFLQQANRPPVLDHILVEHDGETSTLAPSDGVIGPVAVAPGDLLSLTIAVDPNTQFSQSYFFPLNLYGNLFTLKPEPVGTRVTTAGPIRFPRDSMVPRDKPIEIEIDEDAEPGLARVLLAIQDVRRAEELVRVELEIQ